jgi:cell wall assembly regulator SMI1
MMPISGFDFEGPPINESDLDELERTLGVALPASYRAFLLRHNGGRPTPEDIFGDDHFGSMLNLFLSVKNDEDVYHTIAHLRFAFEGRVPADLLPIGVDAGGSLVCMGITPENYGKIYFWAMDDEAGPGRKPWRRNIWPVADNFDEFLATFRAEP